jgi:hypothetical protein
VLILGLNGVVFSCARIVCVCVSRISRMRTGCLDDCEIINASPWNEMVSRTFHT